MSQNNLTQAQPLRPLNQIIELRQQGNNTLQYIDEKTQTIRNGDFKTRLKQPLFLNPNDTLRLNQVFLQTSELEQDVIEFTETTQLRIDFIRYLKDVESVNKPTRNRIVADLYPGPHPIDNKGTGSIALADTPSYLVNQNCLNEYGGSVFSGNLNAQGIRPRKGEILAEARNLTDNAIQAQEGNPADPNTRIFKTLQFVKINSALPSPKFNVVVQYKDLLGQFPMITLTIPAMNTNTDRINVNVKVFCVRDVPTFSDENFYKIVNQNELTNANLRVDTTDSDLHTQIPNYPTAFPVYDHKILNITAGKYHADELAKIITDGFTYSGLTSSKVIDDEKNLLVEPCFMGSAEQDVSLATDTNNDPFTNSFNTTDRLKFFVSTDGLRFNLYGCIGPTINEPAHNGPPSHTPQPFVINDPPIYCGSDSFGFEYDSAQSKFKISKIHTSIRDSTAPNAVSNQVLDNPTIAAAQPNGPFPPNFYPSSASAYTINPHSYMATSYGGIVITAMTAFQNNSVDYFDFWEDIAGFDTGLITQYPKQDDTVQFTKLGNNFSPIDAADSNTNGTNYISETITSFQFGGLNPTDTITDDTSTIDGLHNITKVDGTATSRGHRYYNLIDTTNFDTSKTRLEQFINTTTTSEIFASSQLQLDNIDFAYYLIDISCKVENEYVSDNDVKKNIFSAINRYYVSGGYLSGTNSGIEYIHSGEPIIISEFDIRILNPDGEIANNLDKDNTIFLEVIRS